MKIYMKKTRGNGTTTRLINELTTNFFNLNKDVILIVPTIMQARTVRNEISKSSPFVMKDKFLDNRIRSVKEALESEDFSGKQIYIDECNNYKEILRLIAHIQQHKGEIIEVVVPDCDYVEELKFW
ncbi:MAG: hypothetical protein RR370_02790 [Synergistaceae bacterium]